MYLHRNNLWIYEQYIYHYPMESVCVANLFITEYKTLLMRYNNYDVLHTAYSVLYNSCNKHQRRSALLIEFPMVTEMLDVALSMSHEYELFFADPLMALLVIVTMNTKICLFHHLTPVKIFQ